MMDAKMKKKVYSVGYWRATKELAPHIFGQGSEVEPRYLQGYEAGTQALAGGRAQRSMVWSTRRSGMALVKVTRTLVGQPASAEAVA